VRQDKCDKHQANPLLTGQLLFGIVQTNHPGGGGAGQPAAGMGRGVPVAGGARGMPTPAPG